MTSTTATKGEAIVARVGINGFGRIGRSFLRAHLFDAGLTMTHGRSVKVFGWYANESSYSCRLVDLIGKLL